MMKHLMLVVFLLMIHGVVFADDVILQKDWDTWITCEKDSQCVPIYDECYNWTAVNEKHQQQAQEYIGQLARTVNCSSKLIEAPPKTLCILKRCQAKPNEMLTDQ